ncbi:hypothetical protein KGQ72_01675, partial [Patescibacteria group bacterium]|nr:hypothetical protein [Patescibacteria group bacterium]
MAPELFILLIAVVLAFMPTTHRFFNFLQFHLRYKVVKTQEAFTRIAKKRGIKSVVVDLVKYPSCIYDPPPITNVIGESTYTLEI